MFVWELLPTYQCPARVGFGQSRSEKRRKYAIHSSASEKKWLEIEKWKWNKNDWKLRSRSESEMKMTRDREVKFNDNLFMKLGVKFHYFSLTFFEKLKWNRNDWKSRSRSESEMKMTRDREVKSKKKFSRNEISQVTASYCWLILCIWVILSKMRWRIWGQPCEIPPDDQHQLPGSY